MKQLKYILYLLAVIFFMAACTDVLTIDEGGDTLTDDKGIGELVLFSAGNNGTTTTRASVIPYMEKEGRFVCKMFYHAKATDTDESPFDTISTPITSWLRVNNDEGNSVYWQKDYDMAGVDKTHQDYKDYGFDSRAQYFYWRNRLDHVFLGFTDYNKLKTNDYGTTQGKLFMYPEYDGAKKTKTGENETWPTDSYRKLNLRVVTVDNPAYDPSEAEAQGDAYDVPKQIDQLVCGAPSSQKAYPGPNIYSGFRWLAYSYSDGVTEATVAKLNDAIDASSMSDEDKTALKADLIRKGYSPREQTAEGIFRNYEWIILYDTEKVDPVTHCPDLTDESTVIYCERRKQNIEDIIAVAPANTFDLRRGDKTSILQQPDPLIALTKMKPTGATQEANRVRLYFKHQFSQIQVNLTKGENTAEITKDNIVSVELLGVTEKGYVFTNINPNGTQIPPSYDPVVISKYTEDQLKENQHGTSFNMFKMSDEDKPLTSITSFNAIAFGQLQAIRITWKEEDYEENGETKEGVKHVATYKITVDDRGNSLVNLKSGFRYMYDFELRRGTIAFIRATIDGWLLDDELNFRTDGTINEK